MKSARSLFALLIFSLATTSAAVGQSVSERREGNAWVRTVMHDDGTRTVSKKDDTVKEIEKWTMSEDNVLLMRSIFQTDKDGKFVRGQVFDSRGNLLYVSDFIYDSMGRQLEERVVDARGVPVRRLIFTYDQFGRAKPFNISFTDGSASAPVAVENAEHYSSTNDHGFQVAPNSDGSPAAPIPPASTSSSRTRDEPSTRASIFKSSAKKSFRNPKRR
jgi:hypothetical protein